ncbi:MAG: FecR family protein [Spirochaetota bacterium]
MPLSRLIKYLVFTAFLTAYFCFNAEAKSEVGKIIQVIGDVDLTDINSGIRIVPGVGSQIKEYHKIRTGAKAYIEILLNDNSKIFMRELSIIQIGSLRMKAQESPTSISLSTGKIRIKIDKSFSNWNLIIKTNVAIIGVKDIETDLGIITTDIETKAVVFEGEASAANSNRVIIKSFIVKKKEEISIKQNRSPSEPVVLPQEILDSWLDYYEVVDKNKIEIKGKQDTGIFDYILRKRKF